VSASTSSSTVALASDDVAGLFLLRRGGGGGNHLRGPVDSVRLRNVKVVWISTLRLPCRIATGEMRTSLPSTMVPVRSLMMTRPAVGVHRDVFQFGHEFRDAGSELGRNRHADHAALSARAAAPDLPASY